MKKYLKKEHNGIGGLFFIMVSISCSFIMITSLNFAWSSRTIAMADNIAHIASINISVSSYLGNYSSYTMTGNPSIKMTSGETYNPLSDFNDMIASSGAGATGAEYVTITWDKINKVSKVQFGPFESSLGSFIRPREQQSIIEID